MSKSLALLSWRNRLATSRALDRFLGLYSKHLSKAFNVVVSNGAMSAAQDIIVSDGNKFTLFDEFNSIQ